MVLGLPRAPAVQEGGGSWWVLWGRWRSWVLLQRAAGWAPHRLLSDSVLS